MSKKRSKNEIYPAGITQEALDIVKRKFTEKYSQPIDDYGALWLCGFYVDGSASLQQIHHKYRYVTKPSKIGEGIVWKGWVRNQLDAVNPFKADGTFNYTHRLHWLQPSYYAVEVLTGDVIPDDVADILDVGDLKYYKEGQAREQKEYEAYKTRAPKTVDLNDCIE